MIKGLLFAVMTLYEPIFAAAQETHTIEPAVLEVRYDSWQKAHDDAYILRVGKTANQFFSYYRYRFDSLTHTNEATMKIALDEFFAATSKNATRAQKTKNSTIGREWLYQNKKTGVLSLYYATTDAKYTYEEDIPQQEWTIIADSTATLLGVECHLATTRFRGREWRVWFSEEIPIALGPWKLGGLPGLILKATADDDFIVFTAVSIKTEHLNPVSFYNWGQDKFRSISRDDFLKYKRKPFVVPAANKVIDAEPYIELE